MNFTIQTPNPRLQFRNSLTRRTRTDGIVIHHYAANVSVQTVHNWHLGNSWAGIGYNFVVDKDGTIWNGRGMEFVGAHAANNNAGTIGIAVQGDYHNVSRTMPDVQFNALVWLIRHVRERYGNIWIRGHRELMATACPGQHFPMEELQRLQFRGDNGGETPVPGEEIPAAAFRVDTQSSPLNVRANPGTSAAVLGTIPRDTLVTATRRSGDWLYVTGGSLTGWASTQFLTKMTQEVGDMTEDRVRELIEEVAWAILSGDGTTPSGWAEGEFAKAIAAGLTDGTRPRGFASRQETAIIAYRAMKAAKRKS
ncbi:MAG: N-acetylmuramoyl-L-alanine amidase [Oscillospiraceae bacterium]|nr:N-acetylmuramoyl-L-alanine amidase [Oscillospiraceae bacterium]